MQRTPGMGIWRVFGRSSRLALPGLMVLGLVVCTVGASPAQTSREEALAEVFPGSQFESERVFLTQQQQERAQVIANVEVPSRLIARYVARREGAIVGRAYVDTHVVRTKNQSLLVCLEPDGRVRRVEVTAFLEPPEYLASELWYAQYEGNLLDDDLDLERAIRPIAGATLTGRATAEAVRRVLAIDTVLNDSTNDLTGVEQ